MKISLAILRVAFTSPRVAKENPCQHYLVCDLDVFGPWLLGTLMKVLLHVVCRFKQFGINGYQLGEIRHCDSMLHLPNFDCNVNRPPNIANVVIFLVCLTIAARKSWDAALIELLDTSIILPSDNLNVAGKDTMLSAGIFVLTAF